MIQRNALRSWKALTPTPEIIVFGDETGAAQAAASVGAIHVPDVRRSVEGTPLISAMFEEAQRIATNPVLCYSNADMVFFNDLLSAVAILECQPRAYLLTGRRHDTDVTTAVDFCDAAQTQALLQLAVEHGKKYPPVGMDYFVFRKGSLTNLPEFAVGRPRWDNWMLYFARKNGFLLVDATEAVFAIHQNHDYSHHAQGTAGVWEGNEAQRNMTFAGGWDYIFTLNHATHQLDANGLQRAHRRKKKYEWLSEVRALHPWTRRPIQWGVSLKHLLWRTFTRTL